MRLHATARFFSLILLIQVRHCLAQITTIQERVWNTPDGSLPDLSQTFISGTTLPISWNEYGSSDYVNVSNGVDLWVTTWDYRQHHYDQVLRTNINLTLPGAFEWNIEIPDAQLSISQQYALRFKDRTQDFELTTPDIATPGFFVVRANSPSDSATTTSTESSSTTSSSSSTALSSSSSSSSSPIIASTLGASTPSLPTTADTECTFCGLSVGAKSGIGIGAAVVVLSIIGAAYFCYRRKRKNEKASAQPVNPATTSHEFPKQNVTALSYHRFELPAADEQNHAEPPRR